MLKKIKCWYQGYIALVYSSLTSVTAQQHSCAVIINKNNTQIQTEIDNATCKDIWRFIGIGMWLTSKRNEEDLTEYGVAKMG